METSRLVFDVEPGRGLAASVVLPTNLNLLRNGHITPEQAFVNLNQMSPLGAVKTAHGADRSLGFERKLQHKDPATSQSIQCYRLSVKLYRIGYYPDRDRTSIYAAQY
jgi:hypothetical protein